LRRGYKLRPKNKQVMQRLVDIPKLYDASNYGLFLPIMPSDSALERDRLERPVPQLHRRKTTKHFHGMKLNPFEPDPRTTQARSDIQMF